MRSLVTLKLGSTYVKKAKQKEVATGKPNSSVLFEVGASLEHTKVPGARASGSQGQWLMS